MEIASISDYFAEQLNLKLSTEWLSGTVQFLKAQQFSTDINALKTLVFEQWLHTDLSISSQSTEALSFDKSVKKHKITGKVVVQVHSLINIASPLYAQYRQLTSKFEDNSGFEALPEQIDKAESNSMETRRMLLIDVSDGKTSLKAIEHQPINSFSLLLPIGSKLLLCGPIIIRRGFMLLNVFNCKLLGGDDEEMMANARPLQIIENRLNIQKRNDARDSTNKSEGLAQDYTRSNKVKNRSVGTPSSSRKALKEEVIELSDLEAQESQKDVLQRVKPVMEVKPLPDKDSSPLPSKRIVKRQTKNRDDSKNIELEMCSPKYDVMERPKRTRSDATSSTIGSKRAKTEVHPDPGSITGKLKPGGGALRLQTAPGADFQTCDPVVSAFKKLGMVPIADAVKSMRFAIGSKRKLISAIMETDPIEPLRIVDGDTWALTVLLFDESYSDLRCNVSHSLLHKLIGLDPKEAQAVRSSSDQNRKKEGSMRIKSVAESLRRLDLIWEIEFFASNGTPVIHEVETYAQKLKLID